MNKREVILGIAIVLIIALAIVVGINVSKKSESEPTSTEPTSNPEVNTTNTPAFETDDPNQESSSPEPVETSSPDATPTPLATPTTSSQNKDISKMTDNQKIEYAKSIAKANWEKTGSSKTVFYSYITAKNSETYIVTVRDNETTNQLVSYEINIKTGTCKETY